MRAPRYKFPDEVRDTTRTIASRMVHDGAIARTPEELDAWISREPEVRAPLERGGYGTAFTAHDLFPLFQVFVERAGGSVAVEEAPARSSRPRWLVPGLVLLGFVVVLVLLALATGMSWYR